jgi:hypothetical protein
MIKLERPNMAVNDPRTRTKGYILGIFDDVRRFEMENTWDIAETETCQHILDWVAQHARKKGKLKHLVINCHGDAGTLNLGQGFDNTNVHLFAAWHGLIEKIWLTGCSVAFIGTGGSDGNVFCSKMAKGVGCYVVAATETQCDIFKTFPKDRLSSYEGLVLSYGPDGKVSWQGRNASVWSPTCGGDFHVPD